MGAACTDFETGFVFWSWPNKALRRAQVIKLKICAGVMGHLARKFSYADFTFYLMKVYATFQKSREPRLRVDNRLTRLIDLSSVIQKTNSA